MLYPLERLEAEAAADREKADIMIKAEKLSKEGIAAKDETEIIKAVKEVYILRGIKVSAEWAFNNVPDFAIDIKEAAERVKGIIEQESGEAALDAFCEYYRKDNGARRRRQHDYNFLLAEAEKLERAARLIKESQQMRKEQNLPAADENGIIKAVKEKYIETQSAAKAAEWAFYSVPYFAETTNKAKERVLWIIDEEESGEAVIDAACKKARAANRKKAGIIA